MAEARRFILHEEFCDLLESRAVYYQPPESLKMNYPCIRYSGSGFDTLYADNRAYKSIERYEGVFITRDPNSDIPELMMNQFEMCNFGSRYTANNLYHHPFTLYY